MAEPFDSTKPDGGLPIALGDDAIRDNGLAIMVALQGEHDFIDGATNDQTGKHSFQIDSDQEIFDVPKAGPPLVGSIAFSTDKRTGWNVLVVWDGAAWVSADINPLAASGEPTIARNNERQNWTRSQNATWVQPDVQPGAGPAGVDLLTMDYRLSPYQVVQVGVDTLIDNPLDVGLPAPGDGVIITLDLLMTAPDVVITFGDEYVSQGGLVQIANAATGERTLLTFVVISNVSPRRIAVTSLPNYAIGGVTASSQIS